MIRIGLLGASHISKSAVIAPAKEMDDVVVACVAARDRARATEFARDHAIPDVADDYAALVERDDIDLVYNGLPPIGHKQWSIAAMRAGKAVLCEKPFAMNSAEAAAMARAAKDTGQVLIEAFHYRFHPLFARVLEIVDSGEIGSVVALESSFCVPIKPAPDEIRYIREIGGGALMDLGCYPVHWVRTVMGSEPEVVSASAVIHRSGVDESMRAVLGFPNGVRAEIHSSMAVTLPPGLPADLIVTGERGVLTVDNPLSPHHRHELVVDAGGESRNERVAGNTTYWHQLQHVRDVLRGDAAPLLAPGDAVLNMQVIDAIYRESGM